MKLKLGKAQPAFNRDIERQLAREAGIKAIGLEPVFHLHFSCIYCPQEWDVDWSCECDDDCPNCGATMTPYDYTIDHELLKEE